MATIQLFISDTPLCFEKAEFTFMEETFVIEKQQLFEKVDAVMHQEVSSALVSLVEKALFDARSDRGRRGLFRPALFDL